MIECSLEILLPLKINTLCYVVCTKRKRQSHGFWHIMIFILRSDSSGIKEENSVAKEVISNN